MLMMKSEDLKEVLRANESKEGTYEFKSRINSVLRRMSSNVEPVNLPRLQTP